MDLLGVIAADRLEATVITCNAAISSCAGSGQWHAALWILSAVGTGLECNVISYTSAVNACNLAVENGPKRLRGKRGCKLYQFCIGCAYLWWGLVGN